MKRVLLAALLGAAAIGVATPATAAPGSDCTGKADVLCDFDPCHPEEGCVTRFCVVYVGKCLVRGEI